MDNKDRLLHSLPARIFDEVSRAVIGKKDLKQALLVALISGGHVLIEGMPGTGKTKLAQAFAGAIGGKIARIQMTPDMMPADITGFYRYDPQGASHFLEGPLFNNVVLADELNRTTPRTQSALLEAMGEGHVSVDGITHPLPKPFIVIATQVAFGGEGTYPLTDVQIDRFQLRATSHLPERDEERQVVARIDELDDVTVSRVTDPAALEEVQRLVKQVHVAEAVSEYILDIVTALRQDPDVSQGPSPRGTIALYKASRGEALLEGRDFVIPDDVKHMAFLALAHRVRIKPEAEMEGMSADIVVGRALERIEVPRVKV